MLARTQQDYADLPPQTQQYSYAFKKVQYPGTLKTPSCSFPEEQGKKKQHNIPSKSKSKRETAAPNDPIHQANTGLVTCLLKAPDHQ